MPLILSGRELDDIHQLAFEQRHMTFLSYWVRKEAALKCLGDGFLTDPQHVILGADDTIIDIKSQSSAKPTSIWSGQYCGGETIRFQWATAVSQTTTEPIWQHHADLNSFMKFL
ncbi:4'-phosphopantetheinyl transferase superfamily protein [Rhizobium sp. P44RR-XXIV]|uniref:4'-phosphopantetheinyl transferase superfamily protein n=1 Tax=Rhizobium sp. P44RR-XXIV TaxID=1921145 RepID=UPI001FEF874D|nr:4'-phosphopantetheinyl transferase superfamily protein [Rhizobium sp. P44RR-XXIV]